MKISLKKIVKYALISVFGFFLLSYSQNSNADTHLPLKFTSYANQKAGIQVYRVVDRIIDTDVNYIRVDVAQNLVGETVYQLGNHSEGIIDTDIDYIAYLDSDLTPGKYYLVPANLGIIDTDVNYIILESAKALKAGHHTLYIRE